MQEREPVLLGIDENIAGTNLGNGEGNTYGEVPHRYLDRPFKRTVG